MSAPKLIPLHIPDYLTDPETILSYLQACLEEGGPELFYKALADCQDRWTV